jgi:hypothetical protein
MPKTTKSASGLKADTSVHRVQPRSRSAHHYVLLVIAVPVYVAQKVALEAEARFVG